MILSLIGMSNAGKSYWAKRLETERGFRRICCDDLIAQRLRRAHIDVYDVDGLASWMGMPYDDGYREREAQYLEAEELAVEHACESAADEDLVIDTTGSVAYLPESLLRRLREASTAVYLSATSDHLEAMIEAFFKHPKPLVWGSAFHQAHGEDTTAALRRCYPELLRARQSRYEALADVTIGHDRRRDPSFTTDALLHEVLQHKR